MGLGVGPNGLLAVWNADAPATISYRILDDEPDLNVVKFSPTKDGSALAVGRNGVIMRSSDNGDTWVQVGLIEHDFRVTDKDLVDVAYGGSNDNVIAVGEGVFLHSQDSGKSWPIKRDDIAKSGLTAVSFDDGGESAVLVGYDSTIILGEEPWASAVWQFNDADSDQGELIAEGTIEILRSKENLLIAEKEKLEGLLNMSPSWLHLIYINSFRIGFLAILFLVCTFLITRIRENLRLIAFYLAVRDAILLIESGQLPKDMSAREFMTAVDSVSPARGVWS